MDLKTLSQQLNISVQELRARMRSAGFYISPRASKINNNVAREIIGKLSRSQAQAARSEAGAASQQGPAQIQITPVISVKDFADKLQRPVAEVIKKLIENGVMATINEEIDAETAAIIAEEFGAATEVQSQAAGSRLGLSDVREAMKSESGQQKTRPPVVAVMGHVDHGKTTLLDAIRKTKVAEGEAGAITQHIGAYQVEVPVKQEPKSRASEAGHGIPAAVHPRGDGGEDDFAVRKITFLDTPGHEAFAAMRARGANVTDIIILVVAADDSVKPQTVEVVGRAKLSKTPMIVAINKIDQPGANPEKVKADLAELGVTIEEWGGNVPAVPISAKKGTNLDKLLETILLVAEMSELTANPAGQTLGVVIESHLSRGQGPVATVLVKNGTLFVGDSVYAGSAYGKIRNMEDDLGRKIKELPPAAPARISGLSDVPEVGDILKVTATLEEAKAAAQEVRRQEQAKRFHVKKKSGDLPVDRELKIILRADVQGSLEAVLDELAKLASDDVKLTLVDKGVGEIAESDIQLAENTGSRVVGFNARVNPSAARLAKLKNVRVDGYDVIYELIEDITEVLLAMMPLEVIETVLGRAKIKAIFRTEKKNMIVGGVVVSGRVADKKKFRILRDGESAGGGKIEELQQGKVEVSDVSEGKEFGMKVQTDSAIREGDTLEVFDEEVKKKTLK